MRVIAGSARRVVLDVADKSPTRPFLEMARGALFNSLASAVPGSSVLDLYAGSGALGIEALSRGASSCVFVERDRAAFRALTANVGKCGFAGRSRLILGDAAAEAARLGESFDLVFVDPPFADAARWAEDGAGKELGESLARALTPDGLVVLRIEDDKSPPPALPGLELTRDNRYGRSRVCRYRPARESDRSDAREIR